MLKSISFWIAAISSMPWSNVSHFNFASLFCCWFFFRDIFPSLRLSTFTSSDLINTIHPEAAFYCLQYDDDAVVCCRRNEQKTCKKYWVMKNDDCISSQVPVILFFFLFNCNMNRVDERVEVENVLNLQWRVDFLRNLTFHWAFCDAFERDLWKSWQCNEATTLSERFETWKFSFFFRVWACHCHLAYTSRSSLHSLE